MKLSPKDNLIHKFSFEQLHLLLAFPTNGNKTLLANGVSSLFINGKAAVINGLKKIKNSPS